MKKRSKLETNVASTLPPGWEEARPRKLVARYETQSEDDALAEDEAVFGPGHTCMIEVPDWLVPAVRELLAKSD